MKEQLSEISQKAQAESIDLWPEIYAELKETKAMKRPHLNFQLARLATVFILFFLGALVVYAVSQIYVDSGLEGERAERLVTQVNQSVTIGDITIRLDWAYADVNRIVFGYTFLDANGNVFQPEVSDYRYRRFISVREVVPHDVNDFRPSILNTSYERIHYNAELEQQIYTWTPYFDYEQDILAELDNLELDLRITIAGQRELYRFLVEIPVYPAQFETTDMVMEGEEVDIRLHELTITPSLTMLIFCYQIPGIDVIFTPDFEFWEATDFNLYFDNQNIADLYPDVSGEITTLASYQNEYCTVAYLAIPSDTVPQTVRLEVHTLRHETYSGYSREQADFIVNAYEARGVHAEVGAIIIVEGIETGEYAIHAPMDTLPVLERQRIENEVMALFYEAYPEMPRYEGDWVIEFEAQDPVN